MKKRNLSWTQKLIYNDIFVLKFSLLTDLRKDVWLYTFRGSLSCCHESYHIHPLTLKVGHLLLHRYHYVSACAHAHTSANVSALSRFFLRCWLTSTERVSTFLKTSWFIFLCVCIHMKCYGCTLMCRCVCVPTFRD